MANTLRIKRRSSVGAVGAPTSLENAELAFNEADNVLYYGTGTGGAGGSATSVIALNVGVLVLSIFITVLYLTLKYFCLINKYC